MTDQLGFPEFAPIVTPTHTPDATIQMRYEEWREANPWVLPRLARLLDEWAALGQKRVGVKAAAEWLRMEYARELKSHNFAVNNSYTSRIARDLIARYPHLGDVIETRELRAA
jgi:hypothetical protein